MAISVEQARIELARRELERRNTLKKPMFSSEEEGRQAIKKAEQEQKSLEFAASPMGFTAKQIVGGANSAINALTLGASEAIAGAFGKTLIPSETTPEVQGIGAGIGSIIPVGTLIKSGKAVADIAGQSIIGKSIGRATSLKQANKYAEDLQREFVGIKKAATSSWAKSVDELSNANPDKTISLRNIIDDIKSNLEQMTPEARNVFRKTPKLKELIDNPELANNVTLKDTQDIINYIQTKVPSNIRANTLDIVDTLSDIRASQLDAFPEMANIRADYAKIAEPWRNIKNNFKFNNTLNAIQQDFGGDQAKFAVEQLFSPETIREMGGYKNAAKSVKVIKDALGFTIGKAIPTGIGLKAGYELVK